MFRYALLLTVIYFAVACGSKKAEHQLSFYHWKTRLDIDLAQKKYLDSLNSKKLYVRFFDVKWNAQRKENESVAMVNWSNAQLLDKGTQIIPTVYITNASLEYLPQMPLVDTLAERIAKKIKGIIRNQIDTTAFNIREVQIDCDWSLQTKDKYFRLLELLKKHFPHLSATIRLHQVKYYTKTGVPPVDRGVLMFYNMGKIDNAQESNSILNIETAQKYLENFDVYPLKLDVALPVFYWGVQFRHHKIVQVIHEVNANTLAQMSQCKPLGNNWFEVTESCYLHNAYVYKGDQIRTEQVSPEAFQQSLELLEAQVQNRNFEIILYHLDSAIMQRHSAAQLLELCE